MYTHTNIIHSNCLRSPAKSFLSPLFLESDTEAAVVAAVAYALLPDDDDVYLEY
jgi:hypothetical protein